MLVGVPGLASTLLVAPLANALDLSFKHESLSGPMNDDDRSLTRKHIDLFQPNSVFDRLAVLDGKGFGREI